MNPNDIVALAPFAILVAGAGVIAIFERALPPDAGATRWFAAGIALAAAVVTLVFGVGHDAWNGAIHRDTVAAYGTAIVALATAAAFVLDTASAGRHRAAQAAGCVLMLVACAGAMLLTSAGDLLVLLVGLEIVVLSLIALVTRESAATSFVSSRSLFLAGGTASALVAGGVGIAWSATGTFAIGALGTITSPLGLGAVALILVGLACMAAFVPMHFWLPNAAAALPTSSALFITVVPRVAALAALLRCAAAITASSAAVDWRACLAILAALTLLAGATGALGETSLRRAVAYLSIAYFGQIAVAAAGLGASTAIAVALAAFVPLAVGLFAIIGTLPGDDPAVQDLRGLARRRPLVFGALAVLLFGAAGLPPTAGFIARLAIFETAVSAQLAWLMLLAVLATIACAVAAARIVFAALDPGAGAVLRARPATALAVIAAVLVLLGGVVPGPLLALAQSVRF